MAEELNFPRTRQRLKELARRGRPGAEGDQLATKCLQAQPGERMFLGEVRGGGASFTPLSNSTASRRADRSHGGSPSTCHELTQKNKTSH